MNINGLNKNGYSISFFELITVTSSYTTERKNVLKEDKI